MQHLKIFDKKNSTRAFEEWVQNTGFGPAQLLTEGASITYDESMQGFVYRFTHMTFALGFIITRNMFDDGIAESKALHKAEALKFSMIRAIETAAANILNYAFTTTNTYADGLQLCSDSHLNYTGGTFRNRLSVDADISEVALEQALLDIGDFQDDRGGPAAIKAQQLIISPEQEYDVIRITKSTHRVDTANNDINAIYHAGSFPKGYTVNHYLTDPDAWFIKTDCPNGLTHYERRATEFTNDSDFSTENMLAKATFRGSWGCGDVRGVFGSAGAA